MDKQDMTTLTSIGKLYNKMTISEKMAITLYAEGRADARAEYEEKIAELEARLAAAEKVG